MPESSEGRVLIVAGEFPPLKTIGRIRTVKFVEHLRHCGWRSVILTLATTGKEANFDESLFDEIPSDTEVVRVPLLTIDDRVVSFAKRLVGHGRPDVSSVGVLDSSSRSPLAVGSPTTPPTMPLLSNRVALAVKHGIRLAADIPDSYVPWAYAAVPLARRLCIEQGIGVIFTTLPPFSAAYVGYRLTKETGIPWIADYRDLWYGDVLREWLPAWRRRLELGIESRLLRKAAVVVTVSEQKTNYMRRLHPHIKARWETLTNGFDTEIYASRSRTRGFSDELIEFVYTGRLFKNRRGYAFAEALGRLKQRLPAVVAPVRVRMLGEISPEIAERYRALLDEYDLQSHFVFSGDVGYAEAMDAQVNCDYLLLIVDTGETSDGVIPGKLFEYVAAKRPIFALCDPGATRQIIERARLGKVVSADDVEACESALEIMLSAPVPRTLERDEAYLAQFDRRHIAGRLAKLLDETVRARS